MDDLISRQALCDYALNQKDKSVTPNDIMRFPSAKRPIDEWCDDCKEYDKERHCCPRWNRVIRETLKDAQVIHCKECRYYDIFPSGANGSCQAGVDINVTFYPWDFCSYAERREDEDANA